MSRRSNESTVVTSAYSVFVRGLPQDATESEIRRHFSDLFQVRQCTGALLTRRVSLTGCVCVCS